ncbi:MAG: hypothetical protein EOO90_11365 [Pedobacter sp.]|nr:MAG: hypothetical protein EOO90_11365 [Pedobacter sp.]
MNYFFTFVLSLGVNLGFAQQLARNNPKNKICLERGHNLSANATTYRQPYTIDSKDSTVMVYPSPLASKVKCLRCGITVLNERKEVRVTVWKRTENQRESEKNVSALPISWGNNQHRAFNQEIKMENLNENKKVASLRNDTLFIYKKIAPFSTIREQRKATSDTTVYYKGKQIIFKTAIFDDGIAFKEKHGLDIY